MSKIHVFTHSADLDGNCSGAIVKYKFPEAIVHGINYGDKFPWSEIGPDDLVYMTDFCLQPFSDMIKLASLHGLIWIDHHKSAHDEYKANAEAFREVDMVVDESKAACELTWEYLFPDKPVPLAVKLLSLYDSWTYAGHELEPMVLPFQMRMRMERLDPQDHDAITQWKYILSGYPGWYSDKFKGGFYDCRIDEGTLLLHYDEEQKRRYVQTYGFETEMPWCIEDWQAKQQYGTFAHKPAGAIAVNLGHTNSKVFDSVWRKECPTCSGEGNFSRHIKLPNGEICFACGGAGYIEPYDLMITFCRRSDCKWNVSLYSTKSDIDCGSIAKSLGGRGHVGAGGFTCMELPFEY